jgi:hypothetical protein
MCHGLYTLTWRWSAMEFVKYSILTQVRITIHRGEAKTMKHYGTGQQQKYLAPAARLSIQLLHLKIVMVTNFEPHERVYLFKLYLFVCWWIYSILRTFIPGRKHPLENKLFPISLSTMASSGLGPYHHLCCVNSSTKCTGIVHTPWTMMHALGLVRFPQITSSWLRYRGQKNVTFWIAQCAGWILTEREGVDA